MENRKPHGYWTKEKCYEVASNYSTRENFVKNERLAYSAIYRLNIVNEICDTFNNVVWTKDLCKIEGLKYNRKKDFFINSHKAYMFAYKSDWIDEICQHMKKIKFVWTKELTNLESIKYENKRDFHKFSSSAYRVALKNGWLDEICSHMIIVNKLKRRCIYSYEFSDNFVYVGLTYDLHIRNINRKCDSNDQVTKHIKLTNLTPTLKQITDYISANDAKYLEIYYIEKYKNEGWNILNIARGGALGGMTMIWTKRACIEEALKYSELTEFRKEKMGTYLSACRNGWIKEISKHMTIKKGFWSFLKCQDEALKYNRRVDFSNKSSKSYCSAQRNGWLDDICQHMLPSRNKISIETCFNKALKYKTRKEFCVNSGSVYKASRKYKILDNVCAHMTKHTKKI